MFKWDGPYPPAKGGQFDRFFPVDGYTNICEKSDNFTIGIDFSRFGKLPHSGIAPIPAFFKLYFERM